MVLIGGGAFLMGSDEFYPDEGPVHERVVAPFRIDPYAVTNADYARFVDETGYVTVAERSLDPADFPGADPADLVPGAMVFTPTSGPVDLSDWRGWWRWEPGAFWRRPFGPDSSIDDRLTHPVVHVAFEDAEAYAAWAGKRLPTETEHEYAARGGLVGARFAWGDEAYPDGVPQANSWIGRFPYDNRGWGGTAPVGSYAPNGYGLYDMTGNVWEWTTDFYAPRHVRPSDRPVDAGTRTNLLGSPAGGPTTARRVLKGGSHLCSPAYCLRFRPAARSPQSEDTGMSHVGFRCVADA
ncbi:formylglycine-generating enzyme family protein [Microbacterium sp. W1N]|uniref:formylglycine-generating enzyme family protein n=1 Tax=Microbacterium festucae TaxID=2977531 RepID=UPI0021BF6F44|nr:formylglycine-generating enzyme family protein [Microbacterium festucae]MCT9819225.1 formylglycine-generating enzyme family protein [Microbacterium festucae]